jgi:hypothetical protein
LCSFSPFLVFCTSFRQFIFSRVTFSFICTYSLLHGCQMVYLHTQIPVLPYFGGPWNGKRLYIFYLFRVRIFDHLIYSTFLWYIWCSWYISSLFSILYQE